MLGVGDNNNGADIQMANVVAVEGQQVANGKDVVVQVDNTAGAAGGVNKNVVETQGEVVVQAEGVEFATLATLDKVYIQQKPNIGEAIAQQLGCCCVEQRNTYYVVHPESFQMVLEIKEDSDPFQRCCCKPGHAVDLEVTDLRTGQRAMTAKKPCKCLGCCACCDICRAEMIAYGPDGEVFSQSKVPLMGGWGFTPTIEVMDRDAEVHSVIKGPTFFTGGCIESCKNFQFRMETKEGKETKGHIVKLRPGKMEEIRASKQMGRDVAQIGAQMGAQITQMFTDADTFEVNFPEGLTNELKMGLIADAILIDYMFYEHGASVNAASQSINVCDMYCCGCLFHCVISNDNNNSSD